MFFFVFVVAVLFCYDRFGSCDWTSICHVRCDERDRIARRAQLTRFYYCTCQDALATCQQSSFYDVYRSAISGLWTAGEGTVRRPRDDINMFIPQVTVEL